MVKNATEDQRQQIEQAKADLEKQIKNIKDAASKISAQGKFYLLLEIFLEEDEREGCAKSLMLLTSQI